MAVLDRNESAIDAVTLGLLYGQNTPGLFDTPTLKSRATTAAPAPTVNGNPAARNQPQARQVVRPQPTPAPTPPPASTQSTVKGPYNGNTPPPPTPPPSSYTPNPNGGSGEGGDPTAGQTRAPATQGNEGAAGFGLWLQQFYTANNIKGTGPNGAVSQGDINYWEAVDPNGVAEGNYAYLAGKIDPNGTPVIPPPTKGTGPGPSPVAGGPAYLRNGQPNPQDPGGEQTGPQGTNPPPTTPTNPNGDLIAPWTQQFSFPTWQPPSPFVAPTALTEQNDPGFQQRLLLGTEAVQMGAQAAGTGKGGSTLAALDQFGQTFATNDYQNVYQDALQTYNTNYNASLTNWTTQYNQAFQGYQTAYNVFENNESNAFNRINSVFGEEMGAVNQLNQGGINEQGLTGNTLGQNTSGQTSTLGAGGNTTATGTTAGSGANLFGSVGSLGALYPSIGAGGSGYNTTPGFNGYAGPAPPGYDGGIP